MLKLTPTSLSPGPLDPPQKVATEPGANVFLSTSFRVDDLGEGIAGGHGGGRRFTQLPGGGFRRCLVTLAIGLETHAGRAGDR